MSNEEIVNYTASLKVQYNTCNPFELADALNIDVNFVPMNPKFPPAHTLKPLPELPATIFINAALDSRSKLALCAHELGHALLHHEGHNNFGDDLACKERTECEANLFAVTLLFELNNIAMDPTRLGNYLLKGILDWNITLPQ